MMYLEDDPFATESDNATTESHNAARDAPETNGPEWGSAVIPPQRNTLWGVIVPMHVGARDTGYIGAVNGPEAKAHLAWITVAEIELLCRHYAEELLEIEEYWCDLGLKDRYDRRIQHDANRSLDYFASLIGAGKVKAIVDDVFKDFDRPDIHGVFANPEDLDWEAMFSIGYAGNCPECQHHSGILNIGPEHWLYCDVHRTKWRVGHKLLLGWRDQTPEEWGQAVLKLIDYREVKPAYPPHRKGLIVFRDNPNRTADRSSPPREAVPRASADEKDDFLLP